MLNFYQTFSILTSSTFSDICWNWKIKTKCLTFWGVTLFWPTPGLGRCRIENFEFQILFQKYCRCDPRNNFKSAQRDISAKFRSATISESPLEGARDTVISWQQSTSFECIQCTGLATKRRNFRWRFVWWQSKLKYCWQNVEKCWQNVDIEIMIDSGFHSHIPCSRKWSNLHQWKRIYQYNGEYPCNILLLRRRSAQVGPMGPD